MDAVATEQFKRPPAQRVCLNMPASIDESRTSIDESDPVFGRHAGRWRGRIEPRQCLGPCAGHTGAVFDDGGTFFLGVGPNIGRYRRYVLGLFKLFKMFKRRGGTDVLNVLNGAWRLGASTLQLSKSSAPAIHRRASARRGD